MKEKKTCSAWTKALMQLWNAAAEVPDWVDAAYDALPKSIQKKCNSRTADEKAKCFLMNLEHVDPKALLQNIVWNLLEDAVAGKIINILRKAGIGTTFNGGLYVIDPSTSCVG